MLDLTWEDTCCFVLLGLGIEARKLCARHHGHPARKEQPPYSSTPPQPHLIIITHVEINFPCKPPLVAPHPACDDCFRIVHDDITYRVDRGPQVPISSNSSATAWDASTVFHAPCTTCETRYQPDTQLCVSCRHLRLPHLSFCLPVEDQPPRISIPKPTPESIETCASCRLFDRISKGEHSPIGTSLSYPLYLSATKWRSQEAQWRVRGRSRMSLSDEGCAFIVVQANGGRNMLGQPVANTIQDWKPLAEVVNDCLSRHSYCGKAGLKLPPGFRVMDTAQSRITALPPSAGYVALSYVWAQAQDGVISKSTKDTIHVYSDFLDFSALPSLVQDAIAACGKLNERYLWVDRYCIVQDDDHDRALQIDGMANIYAAAKLVIVAAASNSPGMAGISQQRKLPHTSATFSGCHVDAQRSHLFDAIRDSPWNTRGWTYQEALLNHRKLFFTDTQVYFECGLRINHEDTITYYRSFDQSLHDKGRYIGATTSLTYDDLSHGHERINTGVHRYSGEPPLRAYQRHLGRYRARKLSDMSDLVNAFAGILNALYGEQGSYHGLPLWDLDHTLLWVPRRTFLMWQNERKALLVHVEAAGATFPSWSWASAPADIPTFEHKSFEHTLCMWFRPVGGSEGNDLRLEVIRTRIREGRKQNRDHDAGGDWTQTEASSSVSTLLETLRSHWERHANLWADIFNTTSPASPFKDAESRILATIPDHARPQLLLRDGVLITTAQVARLKIVKEAHPRFDSGLAAALHDAQNREIGRQVYDHNGHIEAAIQGGERSNFFDAIALSVGNAGWDFGRVIDSLPETAVSYNAKGKKVVGQVVNVMIVKRDGVFCRRVGLAIVYERAWKALEAGFETVLLV